MDTHPLSSTAFSHPIISVQINSYQKEREKGRSSGTIRSSISLEFPPCEFCLKQPMAGVFGNALLCVHLLGDMFSF